MSWVLIFVIAAIILIPVIFEVIRKPMDEDARSNAPGRFAELSQGVTHYQWFGPARGPIMVCIHGLTTPSFVWRRIVPGLALLGFRVLSYDHFGRGYSDRPSGLQDRAFFLQQLSDLLEHEGVADESLTLVGYSMGGAIATCFATAHPKRVKQVILLAPAGMQNLGSRSLRLIRDVPVLGDWVMRAVYPATFRKGIAAEGDAEIGALQEQELEYRGFVPAVLSSLRGVLSKPLREDHQKLAASDIPILAVWAQDDTVIPISAKGTLQTWNPSVTHAVIPKAGHGLAYTHANDVLAEIVRFTKNS